MSLLAKIRAQFERTTDGVVAPMSRAAAVRLATAALLVETMRADFEVCALERAAMVELLQRQFGVTAAEGDDLVREAEAAADRAVSLYEFTRVLNDALAPGEKLDVIELLWRTCLADGRLDAYEDHLVGKVAELLHVSRNDVIRLRNHVRGA